LLHFEERARIYDAEKFDYKIYTVGLKWYTSFSKLSLVKRSLGTLI
jgi:hypothetical protein